MFKFFSVVSQSPMIWLQLSQLHKKGFSILGSYPNPNIFSPKSQSLLTDAARGQYFIRRIFIFSYDAKTMGHFFVVFVRLTHSSHLNA